MINALGMPQRVLLLGATSDIALAVVRRYATEQPLSVVLAARPGDRRRAAASSLAALGCAVEELDFEAADSATHVDVVRQAASGGDIDVAVVAFGVLPDAEAAWTDVATAVEAAQVNYVGAVSVGVALAAQLREQGHGVVVALSSVAGERPRRSNFVYGSTKAGFDAFYTGLGEALREHGARVLVVRPGFVHSKMTTGMEAAPLSVTPDQVAEAIVSGVTDGKEQIWVPGAMRAVMSGLRHVPRPLFRRLPI